MRSLILGSTLLISAAASASAQACPKADDAGRGAQSAVRTMQGKLIFHDGIRQWFELKLDQPQCALASIQLVSGGRDWTPIQTLRDCRVKSEGVLDFSPTGYYSLDMFQTVQTIAPVGSCERKPPFPDSPKTKPDAAVRSYRVEMHVDYEPGDHPITFHVTSEGKVLRPWQAYASYILTGGFVLYGLCGDGFAVEKVFGTAQSNPQHFEEPGSPEDMATFDPESAASSGTKDLHLGYTCTRKR